MRVVALIEYEIWGDEEYCYIDKIEEEYSHIRFASWCWKTRFVHYLLARGKICNRINIINISYEYN